MAQHGPDALCQQQGALLTSLPVCKAVQSQHRLWLSPCLLQALWDASTFLLSVVSVPHSHKLFAGHLNIGKQEGTSRS